MWLFCRSGVAVSKLLEFGPLAELSWWWVLLPFVLAFFWWEFVERRLGLDKKKAFDELEQAKKGDNNVEKNWLDAFRALPQDCA